MVPDDGVGGELANDAQQKRRMCAGRAAASAPVFTGLILIECAARECARSDAADMLGIYVCVF